MASGLAIGGFAQGMSQGLQSGLAMGKAARERERWELEKPGLELAANQAETELKIKKEFMEGFQKLQAEAQGGVTTDEAGNEVERPAMNPLEFNLRGAQLMNETMIRNGKFDPKLLKQNNDFIKQVKSEGALEALQYAYANPTDQAGIKKMFNAQGKIKIGDDIELKFEDGLFGPNMVGYQDGKKVFDAFTNVFLPMMGPEAYANVQAQMKMTEAKEKGETFRTGMKVQGELDAAGIRAAATRANSSDERSKMLSDMMKTRFSGIFRNPVDNAEAARQKAIEGAIYSRAEEYTAAGLPVGTAINRAQQDVFKDFKVDISELSRK